MNNNIFQPDSTFDFQQLSLSHPTLLHNGVYFTKIVIDKKSLYIEAPKCLTKEGFKKNGKKMYCELMFNNNDEEFIHWIENLETTCQKLIYEKKESWFQNELELDDIDSAFTAPFRVYKSGKFYLLRVNVKINSSTNIPILKIYNEYETTLTMSDVVSNTQIISILEIQGIKFTSKSFQIDIELKQVMVMNNDEIFDNCLIKTTGTLPLIQRKTDDNLVLTKIENVEVERKEDVEDVEVKKKTEEEVEIDIEKKTEDVEIKAENVEIDVERKDNTEDDLDIEDKAEDVGIQTQTTVELNVEEKNNETLPTYPRNELELELEEINIIPLEDLETITLKKPNQVYYEIYKIAREKAKKAKKDAIVAFLEAKNIKKTYMLDDLDESDEDDDDDYDNLAKIENSELAQLI